MNEPMSALTAAPPAEGTLDADALKQLYAQHNENIEKLRAAFERLEHRYREIDPYNIYNSITEALITVDSDLNILTCNSAAERLFEIKADAVSGKPFQESIQPAAHSFAAYVKGDSRDGRCELQWANSSDEPVYARGRFSPLLDRDGAEIGYTCLFTDYSIERLLEQQARRQDRLTALGELAAGVAHEMRNPLTTVRGYLQILPDNKDDDEFIHEFSDNLIREIDRLTRLTENLLNMAKPISPERSLVTLPAIVDSVTLFLSDKLETMGARIEIAESESPPPVRVDSDRIKQVFINLLVNAAEAMSDGGAIRIRHHMRNERLQADGPDRRYSVVEVSDDGPGIPEAMLDRLFDPFFTTKNSGTGLGLSLTNRIVEEHGGFLRVDNAPGGGARFFVFIPTAPEGDEE